LHITPRFFPLLFVPCFLLQLRNWFPSFPLSLASSDHFFCISRRTLPGVYPQPHPKSPERFFLFSFVTFLFLKVLFFSLSRRDPPPGFVFDNRMGICPFIPCCSAFRERLPPSSLLPFPPQGMSFFFRPALSLTLKLLLPLESVFAAPSCFFFCHVARLCLGFPVRPSVRDFRFLNSAGNFTPVQGRPQ